MHYANIALALIFAAISADTSTNPDATAFAMETPAPVKTIKSSDYLFSIPEGPPDTILSIPEAFKSCTDANKFNVCMGAYLDSTGKPWILPSMRKAKERLLAFVSANKEYAPIT